MMHELKTGSRRHAVIKAVSRQSYSPYLAPQKGAAWGARLNKSLTDRHCMPVIPRPESGNSRARAGWTVGQPLWAIAAAKALTAAGARVGELNAFAVATASA